MARKRITMNKLKEIIRLHSAANLSNRKIALTLGMSRTRINRFIEIYISSGLSLEEIYNLPDKQLELLYYSNKDKDKSTHQTKIDTLYSLFPKYKDELKQIGVNRIVLYDEYIAQYPDGLSYSKFCQHFRNWLKTEKVWMYLEHANGDKMYVDFAGQKFWYFDGLSDRKIEVEIFVAILPASHYTFVQCSHDQKTDSWLTLNNKALQFYGGVPNAIVPDNLKAAVIKASKYEADINPQFYQFAKHYNTIVSPTRARRPQDKALVENAVKNVYSKIFAKIRKERFTSLAELNSEISKRLFDYNNRIMSGYEKSRSEMFEEEKLSLKPLPKKIFEVRKYQYSKVQFNYHIYLKEDKHYYSVPYRYKGNNVDIYYNQSSVEIFYEGKQIAIHKRELGIGKYTTENCHRTENHKHYNDWSEDKFIDWAKSIGFNVECVIRTVLNIYDYKEQAYKSCMGILSLGNKYGKHRLDQACKRSIYYESYSYKRISAILEKGLDGEVEEEEKNYLIPLHKNIRGNESGGIE